MKDQYETCLIAKSGECSARERIADMEAERDKWKKRTEELLDECDRLNKESCESDSDFIDLVAERDQWKAHAEALKRAAIIHDGLLANKRPAGSDGFLCWTCVHIHVPRDKYPCISCINDAGGDLLWQFNEARFADVTPEPEAAE